jgi:hypothetical protein
VNGAGEIVGSTAIDVVGWTESKEVGSGAVVGIDGAGVVGPGIPVTTDVVGAGESVDSGAMVGPGTPVTIDVVGADDTVGSGAGVGIDGAGVPVAGAGLEVTGDDSTETVKLAKPLQVIPSDESASTSTSTLYCPGPQTSRASLLVTTTFSPASKVVSSINSKRDSGILSTYSVSIVISMSLVPTLVIV